MIILVVVVDVVICDFMIVDIGGLVDYPLKCDFLWFQTWGYLASGLGSVVAFLFRWFVCIIYADEKSFHLDFNG